VVVVVGRVATVAGVSGGGGGGARRERGGRPQVGPARSRRWRRHGFLRRRRRAPLDLAADARLPALRGRCRSGRVAPAARPLVVPPLQQHVTDAAAGRARGGIGRVGCVVVRVVARWAPAGRQRRRRLQRAGAQRLRLERGGGEAGAVGCHGRGAVVFV
jgi:hypothetical protein